MGKKPSSPSPSSFDEFLPGHVHLNKVGRIVSEAIKEAGGIPREFNTMAVDDGIAMGHTGMLYSLPSRDIIADTVEYQCNAHCADALICIPTRQGRAGHADGRPAPQHPDRGSSPVARWRPAPRCSPTAPSRAPDLIDVMYATADDSVSDEDCSTMRRAVCPQLPAPARAGSPPTR